jgi:hypothetical protein
MGRRLYYATDGRMRPLMNLVRVAGGWALEADGRITRELLANALGLVGRTDDTLQAKTNPFELPSFTEEDWSAAERTGSQGLSCRVTAVRQSVSPYSAGKVVLDQPELLLLIV